MLRTPALWVLVLAAGTTNATFNWAVTIGDVVRVVLLFYLMPLWAVLLARLLLHEPLTARRRAARGAGAGRRGDRAAARGGGWPLPRTLAEWLGVLGGFSFALNNVMLRREAHRPEAARALAMFVGGALVAGALAALLTPAGHGAAAAARRPAAGCRRAGAGRGLPGRQPGAAVRRRAPAGQRHRGDHGHRGAVCQRSALLLGAGTLTPPLLLGGALIVGAALLSARG